MFNRRNLKVVEDLSKQLENISLKQFVSDDGFSVRLHSNKGSPIDKLNCKFYNLELY